jgi:L-alanine-DL-glutamate epimerase-like enolase superfamily enzyme
VAAVTAAVEGPLSEALMGRRSDDPEAAGAAMDAAVARNNSSRSALDCALFDLAAQERGTPLWRYLGGSSPLVSSDMTLSALGADGDLDTLLATAAEHLALGITTLKVKAGGGADDVAVARALRDAVGHEVALRIDANQAWDRDEAVRTIRALEDAGVDVELVEQPVSADDIDALAAVSAAVDTPIMADESVWTTRQLREVIARRGADMVNVKLAKAGGLREARALVELARRHGVGVVVGCMAESHVGVAAAAALATTAPPQVHDLDGGRWLSQSPVEGGVHYDGARIALSPAAGLGIRSLHSTP